MRLPDTLWIRDIVLAASIQARTAMPITSALPPAAKRGGCCCPVLSLSLQRTKGPKDHPLAGLKGRRS